MIKSIQPYIVGTKRFVVLDNELFTRALFINDKLSRVDQFNVKTFELAQERAKVAQEKFLEKQGGR